MTKRSLTDNFKNHHVGTCLSCPLLSGSPGSRFCNHPDVGWLKLIDDATTRPDDCPLLKSRLYLIAVELS